MRDDLVKQLREGVIEHRKRLMMQAADRIEALEAEIDRLRSGDWYRLAQQAQQMAQAWEREAREVKQRAAKAEPERYALRKAGDRLSFCAQTSGGTAGTNDDSFYSIGEANDLVDLINERDDARALKEPDT